MFCTNCGSPATGTAFCTSCGAPLKNARREQNAAQEPPLVPQTFPAETAEGGPEEGLGSDGHTVLRAPDLPEDPPVPNQQTPTQQTTDQQSPGAGQGAGRVTLDKGPPGPAPSQPPVAPPPVGAPGQWGVGAPPEASYQQGTPYQPPYPPPAQQSPFGQPQAPGRPPRQPMQVTNPFTGVPLSDYARDAGALVLLLSAFAFPWALKDGQVRAGSGFWWVDISLLIGLAGVALPYVVTAGIIPGWTRRQVRPVKLLLAVPVFGSVAAAIINDLAHFNDYFVGGIGTGVAAALGGTVLMIQPRALDEDPQHADDPLWWSIVRVVAVLATALLVLTWLVAFLRVATGSSSDFLQPFNPANAATGSVPLLSMLVLVGLPVVALLGGRIAGARALAVVGISVVAAGLFALGGDFADAPSTTLGPYLLPDLVFKLEKLNSPLTGSLLVVAAGMLALGRTTQRLELLATPLEGWMRTATFATRVAAAGIATCLLGWLISMIRAGDFPAEAVVTVVLGLASAVALVVAATFVTQARRSAALIALALTVVLGIIALSVGHGGVLGNDFGGPIVYATRWTLAAWFGLPLLALFALTVPKASRDHFGPLFAEPPGGQPAAPMPPGGMPPGGMPPGPPNHG